MIQPKPFPKGYNFTEWRNNPALANEATNLFNSSPILGHILSVLHNEVPKGFPLRGEKFSTEQLLVEHGRIQGYYDCLTILETMFSRPQRAMEEVEADYGTGTGKE